MSQLADSFNACRSMCRHHAKSFYFASHTLPREKRIAAYAVYAMCRHIDDEIDCTENSADRATALMELRKLVEECYQPGDPAEYDDLPWLPAFVETARVYQIPKVYFLDLLTGVEMDQGRVRLQNWVELRQYCYHVASVVGLIMTHIFTQPEEELLAPAIDLGIAMQITNILRDIAEDFANDRIYLPSEDLDRFGLSEEDLAQKRMSDSFRAMMRFEIGRAREHYLRSEPGIVGLPNDGSRLTVWMMRHIYSGILDEIERADYHILNRRVYVSTPRKFWLAMRAWKRSRQG